MRFHLLALPNVQTTKAYSLDGFCTATIKFARILKDLGHTVFLYASEDNEAPCDELVTVITKEEQKTLLGKGEYQYAAMDGNYPLWALSNPRMIAEINKRKQPKDFICTIGGLSQKVICDAHSDLIAVEYSVGYISSFAKYRVFESHIWRHCTHGFQDNQRGSHFDTVIPYFFDEDQFPFVKDKQDYAVYVGRLIPNKGLSIACAAAHDAGVKLKIIGHGDLSQITHGAEYLGALPDDERNEVVSKAMACFTPTLYLEPFGATAVEAQLCGTPVISTNFGAFTETVEHGKTGFRCNYMGEYIQALSDCLKLDHQYIRDRAVKKYSMHNLKWEYERYFKTLMKLWDDGFENRESPSLLINSYVN